MSFETKFGEIRSICHNYISINDTSNIFEHISYCFDQWPEKSIQLLLPYVFSQFDGWTGKDLFSTIEVQSPEEFSEKPGFMNILREALGYDTDHIEKHATAT